MNICFRLIKITMTMRTKKSIKFNRQKMRRIIFGERITNSHAQKLQSNLKIQKNCISKFSDPYLLKKET